MKLTFKPSPNYRNPQSTTGIMRDLTVCLFAITVFSVAYYSATLGANAGLRVIILMVTSILSALVTEAIYFKATKQDIKEGITSSYGSSNCIWQASIWWFWSKYFQPSSFW